MRVTRRQYSRAEKQQIIDKVDELRDWETIEDICKGLSVDKGQYHRWKKQCKLGGLAALEPKSRRPKKLARKLSPKTEKLIKEKARSGKFKSPAEVARNLKSGGYPISNKTVGEVLASAGMYDYRYDENTGKRIGKRKYICYSAGKPKP